MKEVNVTIEGLSPLLMHSARLADRTDPIVQAMGKLTAKKTNKTDEDMVEIQRLEFLGSLYYNETIGIHVPGVNIEGLLRDGATNTRQGKDSESGIGVDDVPLIYSGPKTPDEMWESGRFHDVRSVRVGRARVMRTRPIFREWKLRFSVQIFSAKIKPEAIADWLEFAGAYKGLGDYRPKFGRFMVTEFKA